MYTIELTEAARMDLQWFRKNEQNIIVDAIRQRLQHEPTQMTRNRKRLRPNSTATWELRIGQYRVLYDVDSAVYIVAIQRIGEKRGNQFFFRDQQEDI
jgi:mRNA-degrading endonuclease RelE of RelBE toxin-antitoxin system